MSFDNPVTGVTWRPCVFCGELTDPDSRYTWYRVIGWARPDRPAAATSCSVSDTARSSRTITVFASRSRGSRSARAR